MLIIGLVFNMTPLSLLLGACATARSVSGPSDTLGFVPEKPLPSILSKVWSQRLDGFISELNISSDGRALLVATLPNFELKGGSREPNLVYFTLGDPVLDPGRGASGSVKEKWRHPMKTQVKAQALSQDGSLVLAVTHDDKILAYDSRGAGLWEAEANCQPILMESRHEILCYHDDDAEPGIAFDVYDWTGKKLTSFAIQDDVLALKVSRDEKWVALALTHGQVLLLNAGDSSYKPLWKTDVESEVVDIDVSTGPDPRVAVLRSASPSFPSEAQVIEIFDSHGKLTEKNLPRFHVDQLGFSKDSLFVYGNGGGAGQCLGRVSSADLSWKKCYPGFAHYTPSLIISDDQVQIGFERYSGDKRLSEVFSFAASSELRWKLDADQELKPNEDSYLYLRAWAPRSGGRLAVAMDDGSLGVFDVGPEIK